MGEDKKVKGCFHALKTFLLVFLGIIVTIGAVCCAVCPYVSPADFPYAAMCGLAFWPLFFADIFILAVLLLLKSYRAVIFMFLPTAILIPGLRRSYSFGNSPRDDDAIKIMSYNVGNFWDFDQKTRDKEIVMEEFFDMVAVERPDVICIQEAGTWNEVSARGFAKKLGTRYYYIDGSSSNAVFSNYEIKPAATDNKSLMDSGFSTVIDAEHNGKFTLVVLHLTSFKISEHEIDYMHGEKYGEVEGDSVAKGIVKKLFDGFRKRGNEMDYIADKLPKGDFPCIVCGDFNEIPTSNIYKRMRDAGFKDAFIEAGKGFGVTYRGRLPLIRIDYFWHNDLIVPSRFDVVNHKNSDHYPIVMSFHIVR